MGFWYFLILFLGVFLLVQELIGKKRYGLVLVGLLCIGFSIFMFSPGSDEIISDLFKLN